MKIRKQYPKQWNRVGTVLSPNIAGDVNLGDGYKLITDEVRAFDAAGLKLYDDGGNGIFVEDGGQVGIGTAAPSQQLDLTKSLELQTTTASDIGVIYKGADRFIHDYKASGADGYNFFAGINAGNFTMAINSASYHASYNVGVGGSVLSSLTHGYHNMGMGHEALKDTSSGSSNMGIGVNALRNNTSGSSNTAVGRGALERKTGGANNTAIGREAGRGVSSSTINYNTLVGMKAGYVLTTGGDRNILIGYQAGDNISSGERNIILGYDIDAQSATGDSQLSIGNLIFGTGGFGSGTAIGAGKIGIKTTAPATDLQVVGDTRLGDQATNYASFATDGELSLTGTARVKKSNWLPFNSLKAPGTKPATFKEWGISGAWEFSDGTDDTVVFNIQTPVDMDKTVAPSLLIGWSTNTAVTSETARWQLEYLWTSPGEDTTAVAQETLFVDSDAVAQADGLVVAEITGIDLPSGTDVCIHCRLKRLGAVDDLTDTAELHGVCFKYTSNKLGEST